MNNPTYELLTSQIGLSRQCQIIEQYVFCL